MKRGIKAGLDSGAIIDFIYNKNLFSEYIYKLEKEEGLLYTHERCVKEVIEVLIKKFNYKKDEAENDLTEFIKRFEIIIIPIDRSNFNTVKWMFKKCREHKIEFHPPDSFIIADFYKNKIKRVYSNNNHFLDACKLFGISTIKVRTPEKEVEEQLRKMFRFHHK